MKKVVIGAGVAALVICVYCVAAYYANQRKNQLVLETITPYYKEVNAFTLGGYTDKSGLKCDTELSAPFTSTTTCYVEDVNLKVASDDLLTAKRLEINVDSNVFGKPQKSPQGLKGGAKAFDIVIKGLGSLTDNPNLDQAAKAHIVSYVEPILAHFDASFDASLSKDQFPDIKLNFNVTNKLFQTSFDVDAKVVNNASAPDVAVNSSNLCAKMSRKDDLIKIFYGIYRLIDDPKKANDVTFNSDEANFLSLEEFEQRFVSELSRNEGDQDGKDLLDFINDKQHSGICLNLTAKDPKKPYYASTFETYNHSVSPKEVDDVLKEYFKISVKPTP